MSTEIKVTPDSKVKKVILREGTGECPADGQIVEGKVPFPQFRALTTVFSALCGNIRKWTKNRFF